MKARHFMSILLKKYTNINEAEWNTDTGKMVVNFRRPWIFMEAARLANKRYKGYKTHHQSSLDEEASKKAVMVGLHFDGLYEYIR